MFHHVLMLFGVAAIAAVFGYAGIAAGSAEIAKVLFFAFVTLFVVVLIDGMIQ